LPTGYEITLVSMADYRAGANIVRVSAGKETELRVVLSFLFGKFLHYDCHCLFRCGAESAHAAANTEVMSSLLFVGIT
jgi:hypothetical protein